MTEEKPLISRGNIGVTIDIEFGGMSISEVNRFIEKIIRLIEADQGRDVVTIALTVGEE